MSKVYIIKSFTECEIDIDVLLTVSGIRQVVEAYISNAEFMYDTTNDGPGEGIRKSNGELKDTEISNRFDKLYSAGLCIFIPDEDGILSDEQLLFKKMAERKNCQTVVLSTELCNFCRKLDPVLTENECDTFENV